MRFVFPALSGILAVLAFVACVLMWRAPWSRVSIVPFVQGEQYSGVFGPGPFRVPLGDDLCVPLRVRVFHPMGVDSTTFSPWRARIDVEVASNRKSRSDGCLLLPSGASERHLHFGESWDVTIVLMEQRPFPHYDVSRAMTDPQNVVYMFNAEREGKSEFVTFKVTPGREYRFALEFEGVSNAIEFSAIFEHPSNSSRK